jgi:hypothetical protein
MNPFSEICRVIQDLERLVPWRNIKETETLDAGIDLQKML